MHANHRDLSRITQDESPLISAGSTEAHPVPGALLDVLTLIVAAELLHAAHPTHAADLRDMAHRTARRAIGYHVTAGVR